ncbi:MAG: hypothetical protein JXL80_00300 [Planctomycetes bacterium]|nr:hypothetical protein [Planctomycetota bacterium]
MKTGFSTIILCCMAVVATTGCFNSTRSFTITAVSAITGEEISDQPVILFYYAYEYSTSGGHLVHRLVWHCDVQYYSGKSPLKIEPPYHLAFDPFILPGTYWAMRHIEVVPGYEFPGTWDSVREAYVFRPLDDKVIDFDAFRQIQFLRYDLDAFNVVEGVDLAARDQFCRAIIDSYDTWHRRWGDVDVRRQYYKREVPHLVDPASGLRTTVEDAIAEAETVVAKMHECLNNTPSP